MKALKYEPRAGHHIERSAREAIGLAKRHNRPVQMDFNGITLTVNKRLNVRHIVRTWYHAQEARRQRYRNSPAYKIACEQRQREIADKQARIDALMQQPPTERQHVAAWLAAWVPLSDDVRVNRHADRVVEMLTGLGFISGQHVGDPAFTDGTATDEMRLEWIAGQVISMLQSCGAVHPMLGDFAKKLVGADLNRPHATPSA